MNYYNHNGMRMFYELAGCGNECIVLLHGLGSNHKIFHPIIEHEAHITKKMLFVDLIGHGYSDKPLDFDYSMRAQADACCGLLRHLNFEEPHMIAHSMGGAIAQFIADEIIIKSFINCEGNLTIDDCKLSSMIYEQGVDVFGKKGFELLKRRYRDSTYYDSLCTSDAFAIYYSAAELVRSCKNDNILERFIKNKCKKMYVYGEWNTGKRKSQEYLKGTGISIKYIKDSGHNMIEDNAKDFYEKVIEFYKI